MERWLRFATLLLVSVVDMPDTPSFCMAGMKVHYGAILEALAAIEENIFSLTRLLVTTNSNFFFFFFFSFLFSISELFLFFPLLI